MHPINYIVHTIVPDKKDVTNMYTEWPWGVNTA